MEEGESPYKHGKFPLVREYCYYTGELVDDELEPAGVVRDIKDAQRELNKNRSQRMHVVNQQSLGVKFWQGQLTEQTKRDIKIIALNRAQYLFTAGRIIRRRHAGNG